MRPAKLKQRPAKSLGASSSKRRKRKKRSSTAHADRGTLAAVAGAIEAAPHLLPRHGMRVVTRQRHDRAPPPFDLLKPPEWQVD